MTFFWSVWAFLLRWYLIGILSSWFLSTALKEGCWEINLTDWAQTEYREAEQRYQIKACFKSWSLQDRKCMHFLDYSFRYFLSQELLGVYGFAYWKRVENHLDSRQIICFWLSVTKDPVTVGLQKMITVSIVLYRIIHLFLQFSVYWAFEELIICFHSYVLHLAFAKFQ